MKGYPSWALAEWRARTLSDIHYTYHLRVPRALEIPLEGTLVAQFQWLDAGANPIRQPLENLKAAGSLYGPIIYQKAPIVMRQLESLVGEDLFRDGLREYLHTFRYGNATWPDLIDILDLRADAGLTVSRCSPGTPYPAARSKTSPPGGTSACRITTAM